MGERTFKVTEEELNKIFQFVITKPIVEAIEVYALLLEIGKRVDVDLIPEDKEPKEDEKEKK